MPTYEYACTSCGNEWEFEQSIKDSALTDCPKCEKPTAKRQISRGTGFILKGSGWYSDLYASSSNKAPAADGASTSGTAAAATKPAADASAGASSTSTSSADSSSTTSAPAKSATPTTSS